MELHTPQSLYRVHGVSTVPTPRKSWFHRLCVALAAVNHAVADFGRKQRDYERLSRMTESQLRDIGLGRIESGGVQQIVPLGDEGA